MRRPFTPITDVEVEHQPLNVLYLDHDPMIAAQYHVDRHVIKMIHETAQLLSNAWHALCPEAIAVDWHFSDTPDVVPEGELKTLWYTLAGQRIYGASHIPHPSAVWARSTGGNYRWLHSLGMHLLFEHQHRYGQRHAAAPVLWTLEAMPPPLRSTCSERTEPPPMMPEDCKVLTPDGQHYDSVASYRRYYIERKRFMFRWTNRRPPSWAEEHA